MELTALSGGVTFSLYGDFKDKEFRNLKNVKLRRFEMIIYKETEIKNPLYIATLDNGVILIVYDGYAEGSDGRVYKPVAEDIGDGECEVVGWC